MHDGENHPQGNISMNEEVLARKGGVLCYVLRRADRQPGTRLISDRYSKFILIGEDLDTTFTPSEDTPALRFVREQRFGQNWTMYAQPFDAGTFAFGGNWLSTGDSRFPADHPI